MESVGERDHDVLIWHRLTSARGRWQHSNIQREEDVVSLKLILVIAVVFARSANQSLVESTPGKVPSVIARDAVTAPVRATSHTDDLIAAVRAALQWTLSTANEPVEFSRYGICMSQKNEECAGSLADTVRSDVRRALRQGIGRCPLSHDTVRVTVSASEPRVSDSTVALLVDVNMDARPNEPYGDAVTFLARRPLSGVGGMSLRAIYHATLAPRGNRVNTNFLADDTCHGRN